MKEESVWWQRVPTPVIKQVSDLMQWIDAYAYDYMTERKLCRSRQDVERKLAEALHEAKKKESNPFPVGTTNALLHGMEQLCAKHGFVVKAVSQGYSYMWGNEVNIDLVGGRAG